MNTRGATLDNSDVLFGGKRTFLNDRHYWAVMALLLAMLLAETLPLVLVLPALALILFATSLAATAVSRALQGAAQERAQLFAAVTMVAGLTAAVLTDVHQLVPYLL